MTTPPTDTTAALEAAILKYGGDAAESYEFHARPPDDRDLKAAIAAHVAAEVARALACAPEVGEAMGALLGQVGCAAHHRDELAGKLLAAIAADKARAMEGMRPVLSQADAERLVGANDDETLAATGDTTARAALLAALTGEVAP